jgi:hypothetical protein
MIQPLYADVLVILGLIVGIPILAVLLLILFCFGTLIILSIIYYISYFSEKNHNNNEYQDIEN